MKETKTGYSCLFFIYCIMNEEQLERLKQIEIEDIIIGIFFILLILAYSANQAEKNYFIYGLEDDKRKYYYTQIFIFIVVVIVNIYYLNQSYKEMINTNKTINPQKAKYTYLSLIANIAVLIGGLIILYIAITDTDIDAEITL